MSGRATRVAALTAGTAALGAATAGLLRARPEEWPPPPGELVDVAGETLHVLAGRGGSGPTVVFESALSCPCTEWSWVLRALDGRIPYLAYDRPGNGWSSLRTSPVAAAEFNALTRDLLRSLGLPGPYLLVGHSVGGLLVRAFAANHPEDTAGIVLVDSSHPDQLDRSAAQRDSIALMHHGVASMILRTRFGVLRGDDTDFGALHELPHGIAGPSAGVMRRPEPWRAARRELGLWHTRWAAEVRKAATPASTPVAVVTSGVQATGDPAHARMQAELAALSSVSRHDLVAEATHDGLVMQEENAAHVTDAVRWALAALREREATG